MDPYTLGLVAAVLAVLAIAWGVGRILSRQPESGINPAQVAAFNLRIRGWLLMCSLLAAAVWLGNAATVILFGLISFWALREYITVTPTRPGDHRALFLIFFVFTPLQYLLVGLDQYELYSIMIPVYAFLFVPARVAFAGDYKRFLERTAKIQSGLMVCVYCISYAPALLTLLHDPHGDPRPLRNSNVQLLFFFIVMTQLGDILQFVGDKFWGRRVIAPAISASRTWEGLGGGVGCTALMGALLWWATPFTVWQASIMAGVIALSGFAGSLTMSAIKRDRGVQDYGTLVEGHGGVLDRIDSLCFSAPVFYHVTKMLAAYGWLELPGVSLGG